MRDRSVFEYDQVAIDTKSMTGHCRERPREGLPRHAKLGSNQALLQRKSDGRARISILDEGQHVAADPLLGRPELQVLRMLDLTAELCRLTGQHSET